MKSPAVSWEDGEVGEHPTQWEYLCPISIKGSRVMKNEAVGDVCVASGRREQREDVGSDAGPLPEAISALPTVVPDLELQGELGSLPTSQKVHFCCHAPKARSVFLVGTFNNWDPHATAMTRNEDGQWSVDVELAEGRYEYDFVVDGRLCREPAPDGTCPSVPDCVSKEDGALHRVIEIA